MDLAARYTSLVGLADQMRQVLDRKPVGDPTANRIVPPAQTSRAGAAFGTSLMTSRLVTFVHRVTTTNDLSHLLAAKSDGQGRDRTADLVIFSRVRVIRMRPGSSA